MQKGGSAMARIGVSSTKACLLSTATALLLASAAIAAADISALPAALQRLVPLHKPLGKPNLGDWLDRHKEPGQSYKQYLTGRPIRATAARKVIYVQPLGDFDDSQRKIIALAAEFEGLFFQLPVRVREDLPLSVIPEEARRIHPQWNTPQIRSTYILSDVLKPRLPADAVASIAFTASDLWPGEDWNFVFGQASLADRVGVWSIHRFGDPDRGNEPFRLTLRRTLRTAVHETGHMFSMAHCIYYQCVMNGSNHLDEADQQPLWLCPVCLAKLCHATGANPRQRFRDLIAFAKRQGLDEEAAFWQRSLDLLPAEAKK
jgi:archaemetzincin